MELVATNEKTKKQKIKKWFTDNKENILVGTGITAVTGAYVWLVIAVSKEQEKAIREYNEWAEETNQWLTEEHNSGNDVYQLADGRYLVVPSKDNPAQLVRR
jgi:gas vesicle protein